MANLIPAIGSIGLFTLLDPFQNDLHANAQYTCVSVRRLADFAQLGVDPKALYYDPKGIDVSIWTRDSLAGDVCIVSLQATSGDYVRVPTSFIAGAPAIGGVPYTALVLGISLGAVPDALDLSNLYTSVENLVKDVMGVTAQVKSVAVSETQLLSQADASALEAARTALITSTLTDSAKLLAAQQALSEANDKITVYEAYIAANIPPPTPSP